MKIILDIYGLFYFGIIGYFSVILLLGKFYFNFFIAALQFKIETVVEKLDLKQPDYFLSGHVNFLFLNVDELTIYLLYSFSFILLSLWGDCYYYYFCWISLLRHELNFYTDNVLLANGSTSPVDFILNFIAFVLL